MNFLLVAERELRAGARRKGIHRLRWITAALFFGLLVWILWVSDNTRSPKVFHMFAAVVFFYCLLVGAARTADCLSSEKREGTLGLLFLTNLRGPEIIGGKLCSNALAAAYGLFAIFPLLALQMLIGGITLGQFWQTVLALVNVIFFSVSAGFLASSICLRQFTAIASATGLALFLSVGLLCLAEAIKALFKTAAAAAWVDGIAVFSPLYTLVSAYGGGAFGRSHFWWSFGAVAGLAGLFLALSTWQVSNSWRDRATGNRAGANFRILQNLQQLGLAKRAALRRRLLTINPFYWLGGRSLVSAPIFMVLIIIVVAITSGIAAPYFGKVMGGGTLGPMIGHLFAWLWGGIVIQALSLYYAAMVASRSLAEDKETGALELILSTPASERSISRGLWMAYGRRMFFPAMVAILVHFFFIWQGATLALLDGDLRIPAGTTQVSLLWHTLLDRPFDAVRIEWGFVLAARIVLLVLVLLFLVWITLGWIGRWLGLSLKHPGFAPMISLAVVAVPPVLLFTFVCYCADKLNITRLPGRQFVPMMMWTAFGIGLAHCTLVSSWASGRLRRDFRAVVTSRFQPRPTRAWWRPTRRQLVRFGVGSAAAAAALVLSILCFYGYQNWRSRRAWSAFENRLRQGNEPLDLAALLPSPVPANQNFAVTPEFQIWVKLIGSDTGTSRLFSERNELDPFLGHSGTNGLGLEWLVGNFSALENFVPLISPNASLGPKAGREEVASTVLLGLKAQDETMRSLAAAARLPYFQVSTNRDAKVVLLLEAIGKEPVALARLHMLFQVRACALLATGRDAEASEDVLTGLELARLARQMPHNFGSVRVQVLLARTLQPLWEGIVGNRWTAEQLAAFQAGLSHFNCLADHNNAIRRAVLAHVEQWRLLANGEGDFTGQTSPNDTLRRWQPRAWWLDDCAALYQAGEAAIAAVDASQARVTTYYPWSDLEGLPLTGNTDDLFQTNPWGRPGPRILAFAQNAVNQAIIACALERYRLAEGRYPETLDKLLTKCLTAIPNDVVSGRPMLYECSGNGRFILRGVGPNQRDDRKNKASDDWLWAFPTNGPSAITR